MKFTTGEPAQGNLDSRVPTESPRNNSTQSRRMRQTVQPSQAMDLLSVLSLAGLLALAFGLWQLAALLIRAAAGPR